MFIELNEADYRHIDKIQNDNFNYELKVDMANAIIGDISDNLYTMTTKIESIQKIANSLGINIDNEINNIILELNDIFSNSDWQNILNKFNLLD